MIGLHGCKITKYMYEKKSKNKWLTYEELTACLVYDFEGVDIATNVAELVKDGIVLVKNCKRKNLYKLNPTIEILEKEEGDEKYN